MRDIRYCLVFLVVPIAVVALGSVRSSSVPVLPDCVPSHPRIIAAESDFAALRASIDATELGRLGKGRLVYEADQFIAFAPERYEKEGRRLLAVSQRVLWRVLVSAMAYKATGEARFADRAIREARVAASFDDWNPSHFLDTAEMAFAVAVAYDWLYDRLSDEDRALLRGALVEKALKPSEAFSSWRERPYSENNWAEVCNMGLIAAALAVADTDREIAGRTLAACVARLRAPFRMYAPNGGFPEGPGVYWAFGTNCGMAALAMLEKFFGTDFGLGDAPGLSVAGEYPDMLTGPSGEKFNYCDDGSHNASTIDRTSEVAMWYLARRFNRPDILAGAEIAAFRRFASGREDVPEKPRRNYQRLWPLTLLWLDAAKGDCTAASLPLAKIYRGSMPVAVARSSWGRNAWFYGLKAGTADAHHGHMDTGSFVLDALGARWAIDFGSEDYHKLESSGLGMRLWEQSPQSPRWNVFRLGLKGHNTLVIGGANQDMRAFCDFDAERADGIVRLDMTKAYPNAAKVVRTARVDAGSVCMSDEIVAAPGTSVVWQMYTKAKVERVEGSRVVLAQEVDGETKRLEMQVVTAASSQAFSFKTEPAPELPENETPNPGVSRVFVETSVPESGCLAFGVVFSEAMRPFVKTDAVAMKLEHLAMNVPDPVGMAAWWNRNLGMTTVYAGPPPVDCRFIRDYSGTMCLELYHNPKETPDYAAKVPLELHIGFECDDPESESKRLVAAGAKLEAMEYVRGMTLAMMRDPWGVCFQLCKRPEPVLKK